MKELLWYKRIRKDHPRSYKGWICEHIVVAEEKIGRYLLDNEVVHHIDGNIFNNSPDNLDVMTRMEHARLHHPDGTPWLGTNSNIRKDYVRKEHINKEKHYCKICGNEIASVNKLYCSYKCEKFSKRKVERPSKEDLTELIKVYPFTSLSNQFGVSDNAIRKWCKSYDINIKELGIKSHKKI